MANLRSKLDLGDGAVDAGFATRVMERNCYLQDFFLEPLPKDGAVIDVGARVGCFAMLALETLQPRLLVAFEPESASYDLLVKNVAALGSSARIETVRAALWSYGGSLPATTLDRHLVELGVADSTVRVLKIDAAGAETEILEGGAECLRHTAGLVGEIRDGEASLERFRELLKAFVVAIGAPAPEAERRTFWAVRKDLIPARQRRGFLEQAAEASLRESLRQLEDGRPDAAASAPGSRAAVLVGSLEEIAERLRQDRDVIEWQKGSLVRLRRDHDAALRRAEERHEALERSDAGLDRRLDDLEEQLRGVEASVERTADLARELSRQAGLALADSIRGVEERLGVLGRRLNTLQESASQSPDLAEAIWSSKPWRIYHWLGSRKRAWSLKLAPLTERLRLRAPRGRRELDAVLAARRRRDRRARRFRALYIDRRLPAPDRDGRALRAFNLLSVLQELGFDLAVLPRDLEAHEPAANALAELGVEVLVAPAASSVTAHLEASGPLYDLVIVSSATVAADCLADARRFCPRARIVFDTGGLGSLAAARRATLEDSDELREAAARARRRELELARRADLTLITGADEKSLLTAEAPELALHLVSTIHRLSKDPAGPAGRQGLLLLADFEQDHNLDAATWLVEEILPRIDSRSSDVLLRLAGRGASERLASLASERVEVAGFLPRLEPCFDGCRVAVAPLRYAAGAMAQLTQAMAHGVPCVTTPVGAEGIGLEHGRNAMIGNSAEELAECVCRLLADDRLWLELSQAGLDRVRGSHSFAAARQSVAVMLEAAGHPWALARKLRMAELGSAD